ncbi:reverse transcriptase domain-containing protein [Tanacetum coccineum]
MRTRSSLEYTIPRRRNCRRSRHRQEAIPLNLDPIPMADNRTMAQMLQAPIEGYEDAIVVPPINANNFELKQPLINLVQSNKFTGRQDPHNHLRFFNKVTSTFRHPEVPNTSVKLLLFPFSLDGEARDWLDKEPPRSILTWDDLVSKFINQYFPPSKTTYYRNENILLPNQTKPLMKHGNVLKDSFIHYALDSAAGGNFLDKMPQEGLAIIESKSKVRYSRSRANDPRMNKIMNEMKALVVTTPAPVKAVEERCTTCGNNHSFNVCPMTRGGYEYPVYHDNFQQFQQTASVGNFVQNGNSGYRYNGNRNVNQTSQVNHGANSGLSQQAQAYQVPSTQAPVTYSSGLSYTPVPPIPPPLYDENEPLTEKETEVTKDKVLPSTKDIQPPVIQQSQDPVKPNMKKKGENDKVKSKKFWEMFKKIHVDITLADALILVPKYQKMLKSLLSNKEKLNEMANTPPESNNDSTTSAIVDEFESLLGDIIKQKEELKGISDPVARRRACFANLDKCKIISQGRVIHSPKKASISAISHIFPNNNFEDSFKMGNEDLNCIPNKELDKEILIPIPRESKIGKDCDFPSCDDFQSFKTFSNPLFEKQDDFPSRNDESILKEEVHKETFKSYLNPLFEEDEEIISNEASSIISPKIDVKTIVSFFAPIGNCVRKWATSEFVKDNVEISHEVFKSDSENSLGIHDDKEEEIAFLDGLLEDENFFEMNDKKVESFESKTKEVFETKVEPEKKKELQVFHPDIEILDHLETTSYVGSDYVFYEDFNLDSIFSTICHLSRGFTHILLHGE